MMFGCQCYQLGVTLSVVALTSSGFGLVVVVDTIVVFAAAVVAASALYSFPKNGFDPIRQEPVCYDLPSVATELVRDFGT